MDGIGQHSSTMPQDARHKLEHEQQQIDHAAHKGHPIDAGLAGRLFGLLCLIQYLRFHIHLPLQNGKAKIRQICYPSPFGLQILHKDKNLETV